LSAAGRHIAAGPLTAAPKVPAICGGYCRVVDERAAVNQRRWDDMTDLHVVTYRIDEVDAVGKFGLKSFECGELGDIAGQRICHLQCHIGDNSFGLAQLGAAEVVGVDFSTRSIAVARMRAERIGLADRVRFVQAAVDDAAATLGATFDGVYTSWGVLAWLPDIRIWAENVSGLLKEGGWVYVADTHPFAAAVRWASYTYGGRTGVHSAEQGDYTDATATFDNPESWQWNHGLGEILTALTEAGMRLRWLHEHAVVAWHMGDPEHMVERSDGMWEEPDSALPLSFSLRAVKN
jgi:2-polyprenyl-3-methyl-5-hydroxy-6-metoxy-1,4-benzoquinol methylase